AGQQAEQEYTNLITAANNLRDQKKYDDAIAKYNEAIKKKSTDPYPSQQIAAINKLKEEEKNKLAQENKFKELVTAGDNAVKTAKLEEAKAKYDEALALKQDPAVKTKLDDVNKKLADLHAKEQNKAKYEGLITDANSLQSQGKLEDAKAKFVEAGKLDPSQTVPPTKIKEIDDLIAKNTANKQKTEKYNATMTVADQLKTAGKLKEAKTKYQEALSIDATQSAPKDKITEIDNLIADQAAEADKKVKIDKLIADGTALLTKNDFDNSKTKFEEVLKLDASNTVAQAKINEINTKQNALKGQAEKDKQFELLKSEGMKLASEKKWNEAKSKLEEANTIKTDATISAKLKEVEAALLAEKQKAEKYTTTMAAADQLKSAGKLKEAKAKYQEAQALDPSQTAPKDKITEVDNLLAGQTAEADKKVKIDKLIADGTALFTKNDLDNSKTKFEEVLKLDASNTVAQAKINEINTKQNALKGQAEKDKQFELLKSEGMKLASEKKWNEAKSKLEEANTIKTDASITAKLKEVDAAIKANEGLVQLDKDYSKIMADADAMVANKNYDGAIALYKEAQVKKPSENLPKTKIVEVEELKKNSANQAQIDVKYKALMADGDKLVAAKKYLEAIKKYNEALALKPTEKEPVEKAAKAQIDDEAQGSEDKKNYEKIITGVTKAITEKDYVRAKDLIERAKSYNKQFNIVPNDKRPDELLAQVNAVELAEKQYKEKISTAENAEKSKDYKKAIQLYEEAKKLKPEEASPPQKIEELSKILAAMSSEAEKLKLYSEAMANGEKNVKSKKYNDALSNYQNALVNKPDDVLAKAKLAEVQQLIDNAASANNSEAEKKVQFDKYIKEADAMFTQKDYKEAKRNYELALTVIANDKYAAKQVSEMDRLLNNSNALEKELAYKKVVKTAEDFYKTKDYLAAKENYNKALEYKPNDAYATKKLKELEVILNTTVESGEKLKPLGDPIDNSLIDGMAALNAAEEERKKLEKAKLAEGIKNVNDKESSLTVQKQNEHYDASQQISNVQTEVEETAIQKDENRLNTVETYTELFKENELKNSEDVNFEKQSNLKDKEKIATIETEKSEFDTEKSKVSSENGDKMKKLQTANDDHLIEQNKKEYEAEMSTDEKMKEIHLKEVLEPENDDEQRKNTQLAIEDKDKKLNSDFTSTEENKAKDRQDGYTNIDGAINKIAASEYEKSQRAPSLNEEIKKVEKETNDIHNEESVKDINNGIEVTSQVSELVSNTMVEFNEKDENRKETTETIKTIEITAEEQRTLKDENDVQGGQKIDKHLDEAKTIVSQNSIESDLNRQETVEVYKETAKSQEEALFDKGNSEIEKHQTAKNSIEEEKSSIGADNYEKEKEKNDNNIAVTKSITTESSKIATEKSSAEEQKIKETNDALHSAKENNEKDANSSNENEKVNTALVQDVNKSMQDANTNNAATQTDKHLAAQQEIHDKQNEEEVKPVVKNSIGSQYPEGVSQESFTNKDQNGLMTSIITRRIVVIEGKGTVYVRTQTLQGTTYSKNDVPITEYLWQKETQGANLKRNY
ncbi:MAG: hypothetical protein HYR91_14965, partial [Flavobacteriia bacterium]|nr:hypothetical protein [Flavobacteriia bacterium]